MMKAVNSIFLQIEIRLPILKYFVGFLLGNLGICHSYYASIQFAKICNVLPHAMMIKILFLFPSRCSFSNILDRARWTGDKLNLKTNSSLMFNDHNFFNNLNCMCALHHWMHTLGHS